MAEEKREAMVAIAARSLPARRVGQPGDVANAVLFLATTAFATGSTVRVDGSGAIASAGHDRGSHRIAPPTLIINR
jgi:NAD(P)-dependent dehydrogenase (short-subunit alcohol dehydrogenase family)